MKSTTMKVARVGLMIAGLITLVNCAPELKTSASKTAATKAPSTNPYGYADESGLNMYEPSNVGTTPNTSAQQPNQMLPVETAIGTVDTSNFRVTTVNNLPNGRGYWSSRVYGARPNATVFARLQSYIVNGNAISTGLENHAAIGTTGADGQFVWGGQQGCPDGSTCHHSWMIMIEGVEKPMNTVMKP